MFEFLLHLKKQYTLLKHAIYHFYSHDRIKEHIYFCIEVLVEFFHKARISLLYDGRKVEDHKVYNNWLYYRAIQLIFLFSTNNSLQQKHNHLHIHIHNFHNTIKDLQMKFEPGLFAYLQYKSYHSLVQQQQKPNKIHSYFDL